MHEMKKSKMKISKNYEPHSMHVQYSMPKRYKAGVLRNFASLSEVLS